MSGPALALVAVLAAASTAAPPPVPARWVDDGAGMMTPGARDALDARLESYERATGHQVVVWTGKTLNGAPLDDWSVRTFAAWKVGRAGFDDGLAMFVFADDHAIDIEVGYGLEAKVPDAIASRVIREVMAPRLRAGDADGAVTAGVDSLLTTIEGHPWTTAGATQAPPPAPEPGVSAVTWIFWIIAAIALLILFVTHPGAALWLLWALLRQGGGGGGDGGFSGGGGRSGGGGGRGGW